MYVLPVMTSMKSPLGASPDRAAPVCVLERGLMGG